MGYTHYWCDNFNGFSYPEWDKLRRIVREIIDDCGVPLRREYNEDLPPEVNDEFIRFNGVGDDGHETFYLSKGVKSFAFCKTAYKPYDKVVTAMLAAAARVTGGRFHWSSDGGKEAIAEANEYLEQFLHEDDRPLPAEQTPGLQTYYGFECATSSSYLIWVDLDEGQFNRKLASTLEGFDVEDYLTGTVKAVSVEHAIELVRNGEWDSCTQKC